MRITEILYEQESELQKKYDPHLDATKTANSTVIGLHDIAVHITADSNFHSFWITDTGETPWIPTYGHHENWAYQYFAGKHGKANYTLIALQHGWIQSSSRTQNSVIELNFSFIPSLVAIKARRMALNLIRYFAGNIQAVIVDLLNPRNDVVGSQQFSDYRQAYNFLRSIT